jgi:hypothetical protein
MKLSLCFQAVCVLHMKTISLWIHIFQACFIVFYVGKLCITGDTMLVLISLGNTGVFVVRVFIIGLTNLNHICKICIAIKSLITHMGPHFELA